MSALGDEVALIERVVELEESLRRAHRAAATAKAKTADLVEAVHRAAKDAALAEGAPSPPSRPARDRRKGPEVALLHATDWQLGKRTDSYDIDVCKERVRLAVAKTLRLAEIQRADHPVRECHLILGGDLVEGATIFPGQAWEVEASAFTQLFAAASLIRETVLTLLGAFESVHVWEVHGNHGRLGRKGDHPREDNLDAMAGRIARERMEGTARLVWHEPHGWYSIAEIGAYRCLIVHGDQVKSFGGNVPAFGIVRKATAWASGVVEPFDDVYMGHFHNALTFSLPGRGRVFVTPSTESGSEYAREFVAARGRPAQRLHFIDPEAGRVTAEYLLDLEAA